MNKYKDKKSSGCAMCKPHKHGLANRFKEKDRQITFGDVYKGLNSLITLATGEIRFDE